MSLATTQPASVGSAEGGETDAVVACVGGCEGEFAGLRAFKIDDAMVGVKDFVDCDGNGKGGVGGVGGGLGGVE